MADPRPAVDVLVRAFQDDPVARWLFPDDTARPRPAAALFGPLVTWSLDTAELATAGDGAAVAVWLPLAPGQSVHDGGGEPPAELLPHLPRLTVFAELAGARHPRDRYHLYLPFLGVAPGHQGRGLGGALLAERLARADAEGHPAYLEASSERSRPLYERHGFQAHGEPITLPDGPRIQPMWREPRTDKEN